MLKNKLLFISFLLGVILIVCSWYHSYPVTISSPADFAFNHISIVYWIGISTTLTSLYLLAAQSKNPVLKWLACTGFVMALFSLSYFYYTLTSSDSAWFRGQVEYLVKTGDLFPSQPFHSYFQWPSFFILTDVVTSVTGIGLAGFEFLQYTLIGFLMTSTLYVYSSKNFKEGGFLVPIFFLISMVYFLDYQDVPFSLAFALLLVMWMLETQPKRTSVILAMIVLYTGICFTHAFVPLFFVAYLLVRAILERSKQYAKLLLLTSIIYLLVQLVTASYSFAINIKLMFTANSEYSGLLQQTIVPISSNQIDIVAQQLSRISTIAAILFCFVGFVYLLTRKRMRNLDKAIFLAGVVYAALGSVLFTLGSRAIPIVFIPISLGASCLFETRFRRYIKAIILVLLIIIVFVPVHLSLGTYSVYPQTKESYTTADFLMEKYNWNLNTKVLTDQMQASYLTPQVAGHALIDSVLYEPLNFSTIRTYNCLLYNVGFEGALQRSGISSEETLQRISGEFDVVYNSGPSFIAINRAQG